jgi:peroxiredoxin
MVRPDLRLKIIVAANALVIVALLSCPKFIAAQTRPIVWSNQEKPIAKELDGLRQLPDDVRKRTTQQLAMQIRSLPVTANKLRLAHELASLSTEGDFGHDTLQEVATTLGDALREQPIRTTEGQPSEPYVELAQLVRYEHVQTSLHDPQFTAAMSKIEADDERRAQIDFTLMDLHGTNWNLRDLKGKVVLVNFWATWCPPCLKEIPDLEALYERFKGQGLVILAISDEDAGKVEPFVAKHMMTYPVFADPKRKVIDLFGIDGIPKSFVYDRSGKLVAQSIDMRTQRQFLEMLGQAGLN